MEKNKEEKISFRSAIQNNIYLLGIAWKVKKSRVFMDCFYQALNWLFSSYYNIFFMGVLFGAVERGLHFGLVLVCILVTVLIMLAFQVWGNWYWYSFRAKTDIDFFEAVNQMLFDKAADVDLACYENTKFYTKYTRAASETGGRVAGMLDNMTSAFGAIFSAIVIMGTILTLDPMAVIFLLFPIVISLGATKGKNKVTYDLIQANTDPQRKKDYVNRTIYLENYAKELRLTNIFQVLKDHYAQAIHELRHNYRTLGAKVGVFRMLETLLRIARWPLAIIYAGFRVLITQTVSPGTFVVLINAIQRMSGTLAHFMTMFMTMQKDGLFIQNFRDFLDYDPKISQSQKGIVLKPQAHTLELRHVSYTYEGAEKPIIQDVNMTLHPGETIALVGHNGAGKTTLIKLLLRLYDPTEGEILLDGVNIKEYTVAEYRRLFGTVFQDYHVFAMSVAENVLVHPVKEEERPTVEAALKNADVYEKIMENDKGIDAMLTREFDDDGLVLSGGEFQKLAIARLYASGCEFAVLDEPTSALDPIAEYQMFENLKRVCVGKTVVFISHRLSSAVLADQVYLMEQGKVVEHGTHSVLMEQNGKYAEMFRLQAKMYGLAGGVVK